MVEIKPKPLMSNPDADLNSAAKQLQLEEEAYQKRMQNLPFGTPKDYYAGFMESSMPGTEYKSIMEVKGQDLRNALNDLKGYNITTISFSQLADAFGLATQSYKKSLLLDK
jgi:hypothetical protein